MSAQNLSVPQYVPKSPSGDQQSNASDDFNNELSPYKTLVNQVREEYELAYRAQVGRMQINLKRLRLYNNQRREPDAVGDTLLYEIFQSVFTALYNDEMTAEFLGRSAGFRDIASAVNNTAKFDYDEMKKAQIDYEWIWDTLFFGNGIVGMNYFDRESMHPVPEVWDMMVTLRDTDAVSINGGPDGKGAARYLGREIMIRGVDAEDIPSVFDLDKLKLARPTRSLFQQARQERENAQGLSNQIRYEEKNLGVNARYPLIEWYTWWMHPEKTNNKPQKVLVWLGNDMQKVVRFKVLGTKPWQLVQRKFSPVAHQWDSVSIPDLVEDKQRMRAILTNLGIKSMKSDLFGMYLFDKNKIKSKADLNFDLDKMVPVDLKPGESLPNTVVPMPKAGMNLQMFNLITNLLDVAAQRATATPEMQIGQPAKKERTATEINKVDNKVAGRYTLASKIFGWSEKEFWDFWYDLYREHFKSRIDEKMVRINTVFGPQYQPVERHDLIADKDPDVMIKSKLQADQQRSNDRALVIQFGQVLSSVQGSNMRYFVKKMGTLHNIQKDDLDRLLPPTPDELKARRENYALANDVYQPVDPNDNDQQHLEEHATCRETRALLAHVATHIHSMELKKSQPQLFPQMQQQQQQQQQEQQGQQDMLGKVGKQKHNKPAMGNPGQFMMQPQ